MPIGQASSGVELLAGLEEDYDKGIENLEDRYGLADNLAMPETPLRDSQNLTARINQLKPEQGWSEREAELMDLAYMLGVVRLTLEQIRWKAESSRILNVKKGR